MTKEHKILAIEYTVIILLWCGALASPLLFSNRFEFNQRAAIVMWIECAIIAVPFLINRFCLMPGLFFAKRYALYFIAISLILLCEGIFLFFFDGVDTIMAIITGSQEYGAPLMGGPAMHNPPPMGGGPPPMMGSTSVIPPAISVLIASSAIVALDMGFSIAMKWVISEQKQAEMKRERVSSQLANLQNQVSPHFLMNTLNNIHALVEIDPKRAQKTIIELSALMDYLLYESSNIEQVALNRELEFIASYINLMRLRYPKRVEISFTHSEPIPAIKLPPLLFLNFIENTFKYGVNYNKRSYIKIHFDITLDSITMTTENTNHSASVTRTRRGIGIANSCKRLKLLYGSHYNLDINQDEQRYIVKLKIPIL